jgi:putative ABC transport system ATP-binding protein
MTSYSPRMIKLQNLTKLYSTPAGDYAALRNIDLEIETGEFVAIAGKSGSGKSTLLNMMGGIDRPSSGSVEVASTAIHQYGENQLAQWRGRNIGFVFQFFQLLPTLTIAENVMLPMDFCRTFPGKDRRNRALDLLEQVGVAVHANKLPSALSGGEQQRAAIARAMANRPKVVLADEPTGNLDSSSSAEVLALFREMAISGTTVVIATHERDIACVVDRRIEVTDGMMMTSATPVSVLEARQ